VRKKSLFAVFISVTIGLLMVAAFSGFASVAGPITANHTSVQSFSGLTAGQLSAVKGMVLLNIGQSHGQQIPHGLQTLMSQNGTYGVTVYDGEITDAANGTLQVGTGLRFSDNSWQTYNGPDEFWNTADGLNNVRRTLDYYAAHGITVDAILHTWCWQFQWMSAADVAAYFVAMEQLESEYPAITFIYMTDTDDSTGAEGYNRYLRNQQVRAYCQAHGKILFDFGELETWSASGLVQNTTTFGPYTFPIWHSDWAGDEYAHIKDAACTMKAKAMWWLLAQISYVVGPLDHIHATPSSATVVRGAPRTFSAQGQDVNHYIITGLAYSWSAITGSVSPPTGALISYTAPASGVNDTLTVSSGGISTNILITLTDATVKSDYNADDTAEIGVLYDYGNAAARLWSIDASGPGAASPVMAWYWNGGFDASRAKITSGDYNADGQAEIGILYDYGNGQARLWSMDARGPGAAQPVMAWYWPSGFEASKAKITSGDYNGDGKDEIGVLYDYGNNVARLWSMDARGPGALPPVLAGYWNGGFDASRAKITSGDYNANGRDEVGILYNYGNNVARLWSLDARGPGSPAPVMAWYWNAGFDAARTKITSGNYNADGKDEIGVLYDYGMGKARVWSMDASGPSAPPPVMAWYWNGGFDASRAKITSGDYNADSTAEIGVLYDYGYSKARLWSVDASGPGAPAPFMAWYWNGGFYANKAIID
jgi:hypothetical protein